MRALFIIDYTRDFVAEDGALTAGAVAASLEDYILETTRLFHVRGDYVVFAVDDHFVGDRFHPESRLFPPHNIHRSRGQELFGRLEAYYQEIKEDENVHYVFKSRYSAFCGTDVELRLRERDIKEVHLMGVVTDICVLHTAMDAYNKGFSIKVHEKGVQSFHPEGHAWAMNHFQRVLGAEII